MWTPVDGRLRRGGRAEELRDPVDGEEGDARDAGPAIGDAPERARSEHPARRHADVVRGDDDAHRRERVAVLAFRDRVAQRTSGREAVRDGDEVDPGHGGIVRPRCDSFRLTRPFQPDGEFQRDLGTFDLVQGVVAEGLVKRFGDFTALDGVDFVVEEGMLAGLLGPNGAGKTTTIRILTTLLQFDGGHATVGGFDVVKQAQLVRAVIGLTGQFAAVDDDLTGRENLVLVGRLGRMTRAAAKERAARLLSVFDLDYAADRALKTYSGGMRRRLDLGASLMVAPTILFLDEPTTGLDPRSRMSLWDVIAELKSAGTTIVLTTQYMEEADRLAERISVIDAGSIIAEGSADELKAMIGGDVLEVEVEDRSMLGAAVVAMARAFELGEHDLSVDPELGTVSVPITTGAPALTQALRALDAERVPIIDVTLRRPSLDDVFLNLTGHSADDEVREEQPEPRPLNRRRRDP